MECLKQRPQKIKHYPCAFGLRKECSLQLQAETYFITGRFFMRRRAWHKAPGPLPWKLGHKPRVAKSSPISLTTAAPRDSRVRNDATCFPTKPKWSNSRQILQYILRVLLNAQGCPQQSLKSGSIKKYRIGDCNNLYETIVNLPICLSRKKCMRCLCIRSSTQ